MDDFTIATDDTTTLLSSFAAISAAAGRDEFRRQTERHRQRVRAIAETGIESGTTIADALRHASNREPDRLVDKVKYTPIRDAAALPTLDGPLSSSGLSVRGGPYDFEWTDRENFAFLTAEHDTGLMEISLDSGSNMSSDHAWGGAGIGIRYTTKRTTKFVRVAPYLSYSYRWSNDSTLEVARNRGTVSVLVRERSGKLELDSRTSLWNDGTGWYESHSDDVDDVFTDSRWFFARPETEYEIWFWFDASIDFNHETSGFLDFGSSRASCSLGALLRWIVIEEFGS